MLQKQGDEREERQAAAEHDQNEQVRLKAIESINSQQKEQYQSRDYRIGKVCNMRVDYVFNALKQLAKEVDRLLSMKRDLVLHVPLLGNDENKTLILMRTPRSSLSATKRFWQMSYCESRNSGVNQAFTRAKTPSDHRSQHNELSRLRRLNAAVDEQIMHSSLQKMLGAMLSEGRLERGRGQGSDAAGGGN